MNASKDEVQLKRLFTARKEATLKCANAGFALDKKLDEMFGFNYSETDDDEMIDTLDYGHNSIGFDHFFELMTYYRNERGFGNWKTML
jgi:hypothetical protein